MPGRERGSDDENKQDAGLKLMRDHHAALGRRSRPTKQAIKEGTVLPSDHPFHKLKALHKDLGKTIAAIEARRKHSRMILAAKLEPDDDADTTTRDDADAGDDIRATASSTAAHAGVRSTRPAPVRSASARSTPCDRTRGRPGSVRQPAYRPESERRSAGQRKGRPARGGVRLRHRQSQQGACAGGSYARTSVRKVMPRRDPIDKTEHQKALGTAQGMADEMIQKAAKPISREQAIDRILKAHPDLTRAFYKLGANDGYEAASHESFASYGLDTSGGRAPDAPVPERPNIPMRRTNASSALAARSRGRWCHRSLRQGVDARAGRASRSARRRPGCSC